jgi:hypothetical protein
MRHSRTLAMLAIATLLGGSAALPAAAQTPAKDPSARLKEVLPADVADRVLATIAQARARELPAAALEHRALKFAAKGVAPSDIEKSVSEQEERMVQAKAALQKTRSAKPTDDEVEAGAEAIRKGVDGAEVSALAKSAPSGRSLAVPLYVIGSLIDRGLPSDQALQKVQERLQARATDADLQALPAQAVAGQSNKPAQTGRDLAATKRPAGAGAGRAASGAPAGVPANAGAAVRPTVPQGHRP